MNRIPLTAFTAGELSPKMLGRFDLQSYQNGVQKLENFFVFPQGGITYRPGSHHCGDAFDHTRPSRLIAFVASGVSAFVVELSENKLRIWSDGSLVENNGTPLVFTTEYAQAYLRDIQIAQASGKLYLVHRKVKPMCLAFDGSTFTFGAMAFNGPEWRANTAYAEGAIVWNSGNYYYCLQAGTSGTDGPTSTSYDDANDTNPDNNVLWRWLQAGAFRQDGDYPGCAAFFAGRLWFASSENQPQAVWASRPFEYSNFLTFDVSNIKIRQIKNPEAAAFTGSCSEDDYTIDTDQDMTGIIKVGQYLTGPTVNSTDAIKAGSLIEVVSSSFIRISKKISCAAINSVFTSSWWVNSTVSEYETVSNIRDVIGEGSAIMLEINSDQNNNITFLAAGRDLILGTITDTWVIPSGITALNLSARLQTRMSSAPLQARLFGENVVFIQGTRRHVREYVYNNDDAAYHSPGLNHHADHILGDGVVEYDFTQNPDPVAYMVRDDGIIAVLCHNRDIGVTAWSRYATDGEYESIAIVPNEYGDDVVYVETARKQSNNTIRRSIEVLASPFDGHHVDDGITLAAHDAPVINGSIVQRIRSTITGLTWLANKTVLVIVNGNSYTRIVGPSGTLSDLILDNDFTATIGLQITASAMTLPATTQDESGVAQGVKKRASRVIIRTYESYGAGVVAPAEPVAFSGSGDVQVSIPAGWNRTGTMELRKNDGLPLSVTGLYVEVE